MFHPQNYCPHRACARIGSRRIHWGGRSWLQVVIDMSHTRFRRRLTWVILHRDARDSQESPARNSRAVRERESIIRDYLPRHLNCVRLSIIFEPTNVHVPGAVPVRRCDSRIKLSILCKLPSAALLQPCSATTYSASSRKERMYSGCVVRSKSAAVRVYYGNIKPGLLLRAINGKGHTIEVLWIAAIFVARTRKVRASVVRSSPSATSISHETRSFYTIRKLETSTEKACK